MVGNYVNLVDKTSNQILAYNPSMECLPRIGDMITLNVEEKYRVNDVEWSGRSEEQYGSVRFKVQRVLVYVTKIND